MIKIEKHWAIWAGLDEALGGRFSIIKKAVHRLKINPKETRWHPISEAKFNVALAGARITEGLWLTPEITAPLVAFFRMFTVYPVLLPSALIIAFSPPQIVKLTIFLPFFIYIFLIFRLSRRLFKK